MTDSDFADQPVAPTLKSLLALTDDLPTFEKHQLRRWAKRILSTQSNPLSAQLSKWHAALQKAIDLKAWRSQQTWDLKLPDDLPITQHQAAIAEALNSHQVIIVCGETGSGKSTQLPLIALGCGLAVDGMIGHTQPRRIAAQSIAARVASQLKTKLGETVGYKIRFGDQTGERTLIKLMTDGILLSETQSDRFLNRYSMIIVDEAHERSLNIDFLLGNLKRILEKRPELKLVITSATIDTERFAEHFCQPNGEPAPIFNIEGRTYPVETRYQPPPDNNADLLDWLVDQTTQILRSESGDVLVFLPTEHDIRVAHKKLTGAVRPTGGNPSIDILPLYARLPSEHQNAIFKPGSKRRVVLATNVAESSITVPRISCVIDTGTARISRYSPRNKVQRLPVESISQASANQRAGRCGRIGPGVCVRLFSQEDFASRPEYTTPEIRRTNLASVILQAEYLKLGDINTFPFIDPPRADSIRDGYKTLFEIGAIDERQRLTSIGRQLGKLPVDPRIGRMIIAGHDENCLADVLIVASALELQDPRLRPPDRKQAADQQHEKFRDEHSDFAALIKIWDFFHHLKSDLSRSKLQAACRQNFLSYNLMQQWLQLHRQLKILARENGMKSTERSNNSDALHRSLLTGLLSGLALLTDKFEYTGAGGIKLRLWPGSSVFQKRPKWIVAAEVVETTQRYARTIARVNPSWIEPLASHLTKSNYSDPHWSAKNQTVMANEKVSLFGLPIVAARKKPYGKIDTPTSRSIFIEQGFAADQIRAEFDFLRHNQSLLESIETTAAKTRRRDFVVDSYQLIDFYERQLPDEAYDVASLLRLVKKDNRINEQLKMSTSDFLEVEETEINVEGSNELFPDQVKVNALTAPIVYKFEPGEEDDGATIVLPQLALNQLDDSQTPWLIPGFMEPHLIALIRSLPKSLRRNFIPAPDVARKAVAEMKNLSGSFVQQAAEALSRVAQTPLAVSDFRLEKVDAFLKPNVRVLDDDDQIIAENRSIAKLRSQLEIARDTTVRDASANHWNETGLKQWSWDDVPAQVTIQRGNASIPAFPAIRDDGESVSQVLMDSSDAANETSVRGVSRLFQIANRKNIKSQINWLPDFDRIVMKASSLFNATRLKQNLGDLISRVAFVENEKPCTTKTEFESRASNAAERISVATTQIAKWLPRFVDQFHLTQLKLDELPSRFDHSKNDAIQQIAALAKDDFLLVTPWKWLQHFPRYFEAINCRFDKLTQTPAAKELESINAVETWWNHYESQSKEHLAQGIVDLELTTLRWMIEEYRVSVFAQQLGTSVTVSPQRLEKQLKKVRIVAH